MDSLVQYTLPISGLKDGIHAFDFSVDREFFACFEGSLIREGQIDLNVFLDKRPDLMVLVFEFRGTVQAECDRCLETFDLPISGNGQVMVKYGEGEGEIREDMEVIYIPRTLPKLKIARFAYEFISLGLPMKKTHEDAGAQCDPEMLKYLREEETREEGQNPFRDVLKNWKENGN